jgi:hypothetical protein
MDDSILLQALTGVVPATCDAEAGEFHRPVDVSPAWQGWQVVNPAASNNGLDTDRLDLP